MRCQQVLEPCLVMGAPPYRQHQQHDDEGDNPAEAEQSGLGSYQALQHVLPGLRDMGVPNVEMSGLWLNPDSGLPWPYMKV